MVHEPAGRSRYSIETMKLPEGTGKQLIFKFILSVVVSAILLSLLIRFTLTSANTAVWPNLTAVLTQFSLAFVLIYLAASLARTILQAIRYRLLLSATEKTIPSFLHVIAVTISRNMFVDMLPARLGELSYIVMLNRGHRVSIQACISSLALSFIFDLISLAVIIAGLICLQFSNGSFQEWTAGVFLVLALVILMLLFLLFPALKIINRMLNHIQPVSISFFSRTIKLLHDIEQALKTTTEKGLSLNLFCLSLCIRILKYFGLFCLFIGVVSTGYPQMTTEILTVLPALISAEAGASLPVPAFLGFGTYEAGGTLALIALGADKTVSLIIMLAIHVISQVVDYLLGSLGVIFYIFKTANRTKLPGIKSRKRKWLSYSVSALLITGAAIFLISEFKALGKRGALKHPSPGKAITNSIYKTNDIASSQLDGFIVWSSNRSGNHDIYLYSLPDHEIRQLTSHPHTEYYPRISPDGHKIVFARSQVPWVSQRNYLLWDIWLLDLKSNTETRLAVNGNTPTWSSNGKYVYFQRNADQVIELNLDSRMEKIIYESAKTVPIPPKTVLQTPSIDNNNKRLAVTLRETMRTTAIITKSGKIEKTGNGCQLTWGPGDTYLYKIDHGGKMQNAIYKIDPITFQAVLWFDAPGKYSHEYFPRVSADNSFLVYGASKGDHAHDTADYEIFLWRIGTPAQQTVRITHHTGNDCWPDIFLR